MTGILTPPPLSFPTMVSVVVVVFANLAEGVKENSNPTTACELSDDVSPANDVIVPTVDDDGASIVTVNIPTFVFPKIAV